MASVKPCTNSNFKWCCVWDCRRASDFWQLLITFLISESDFVKASYADHLKNSDFKKWSLSTTFLNEVIKLQSGFILGQSPTAAYA